MKIHYGGHSSFLIENKGKRVLVDPFMMSDEMKNLKPDVICVSHAHGDHIGSAIEIAKETGAPVMAVFELANYCASQGVQTLDGHIGGKLYFDFGWIKFVPAWHGSSLEDGTYMGTPCGFVVKMGENAVYHTGDTGLFGDMKLIAEVDPIDVFLCPIGDKYTMGIDDAVVATKLVEPSYVIPMHYNTFDPINQDPEVFKEKIAASVPGMSVQIMKPGDVFKVYE